MTKENTLLLAEHDAQLNESCWADCHWALGKVCSSMWVQFHTCGVIKGELVMLVSISSLSDGNLAHETMLCGAVCVHVCVSVCLVTLEAISRIQSHLTAGL